MWLTILIGVAIGLIGARFCVVAKKYGELWKSGFQGVVVFFQIFLLQIDQTFLICDSAIWCWKKLNKKALLKDNGVPSPISNEEMSRLNKPVEPKAVEEAKSVIEAHVKDNGTDLKPV